MPGSQDRKGNGGPEGRDGDWGSWGGEGADQEVKVRRLCAIRLSVESCPSICGKISSQGPGTDGAQRQREAEEVEVCVSRVTRVNELLVDHHTHSR
jgi:hypothetical protein